MKPRSKTKPAGDGSLNKLLTVATLLIALWGACLSTWVYVQDQREDAPRVYVHLDIDGKGKAVDGSNVGEIVAVFSNVGREAVSIAPRVKMGIVDHRTGKKLKINAGFVNLGSNRFLGENPIFTEGPATIDPGKKAVAKTSLFDVSGVEPLDHFS